MSITNAFYLHAIKFGSAGTLTQLTNATPMTNLEEITEYSAGHPEPLFSGHAHAAPAVQFETSQISTLLTLLGADFALDTTGGNTDLEYRKGKEHGYRDATSGVHRSFRASQGLLVLDSIRASQNQPAVASCRYFPTWDGTNDPLQILGSVSLAGTPQAAEQFTLGPIAINGAALPGVQEWTLEMNPSVTPDSSDGDEYPSYNDIETIMPVLTVRTRTLESWTTVSLDGLALTSLAFYLRRRQASKINYADGSSQHILFAATRGTVGMGDTSGGGKGKSATSLKIRMHSADSATASLSATDSSTIS